MSARRFRWESFIERYLCAVDGCGTGFKDVVLARDYDALAASCAQAAKDAVRFQDERDQLAAENAALRDALQSLRGRLQACVAFSVREAYDSFYQELVDEALSSAPAKKEEA